jgi:putative hydrolase of the HAD superfamily
MNAVLFDFGGTIDTDGIHWSEKFWQLYERFRVPVGKKEFEAAFVRSENELTKRYNLASATFHETLRAELTSQFEILGLGTQQDSLNRMIDECYEEVKSTIARAAKILNEFALRYSLGVVSNFYGNLDVVCKEFGLDKLFSAKIDSVTVGVRKPDPAIFSLALQRMSTLPHNAFVVGDSYERDIVPAKSLGCTTIWLKGKSWNVPASTPAADYTIHKFVDLRNILLK